MTARGQGKAPDELGRYYTDPDVSRAIVQRCVDFGILRPGLVVCESSAGGGSFLDACFELVPDVQLQAIDADPQAPAVTGDHDRAYLVHVGDYLGPTPRHWARPHVTIGNPPFSTRQGKTWVDTGTLHADMAIARSIESVVFLLRMGFTGRPKGADHPRRDFHARHPAREWWPLWPRPSFTGGGTDASEYVVGWWQRGYDGPTIWRPLEWEAR